MKSDPKSNRGDEDVGNIVRGATANILADPDAAPLKRIAWAYGCSKVGSDDESKLLELLVAKVNLDQGP